MIISLIIPTLNERGAIERLFAGIARQMEKIIPHMLEIVIVDDGSKDGTVEAIRSASVPFSVKVIERKERGLATAVLRGFAEATGDVLGVMDADLSHPTELLPSLIAALDAHDLVVASRHVSGGAVEEWPWYRQKASQMATLLVRPLGVRVRDPMSGFFFLQRSLLDGVTCSPVGYKILLELLVKTQPKSVTEIPYTFRNRDVGKSKMGMREGMNYLRHLAKLTWWKMHARTRKDNAA